MSKFSELFDSFTFNATLSFVSLAVLADLLVSTIASHGVTPPEGVRLVIWIVIAYHFISVAYKQYKEKLRGEISDE